MILSLDHICFGYRHHPTLKDISFSIPAGEITVILGPNGAGKTTLLKCMNHMLAPDRGKVLFQDTPLSSMSPRTIAQKIGYVAQKSESAGITAFDAVLMGRTPHMGWRATREDLKKTDAVIRHLGMDHLALKRVDEMSGGELQKVSIARALVQETDVILLDEPTSSLDMKNQEEVLTLLRHVVKSHRMAAVITMHDLNTALRFADRCIFLKQGAICHCGTSESITPNIIQSVYGIAVDIIDHHGVPLIIPRPGAPSKDKAKAA